MIVISFYLKINKIQFLKFIFILLKKIELILTTTKKIYISNRKENVL